MPGLLQTQAEHFSKTKYAMALGAEFLGSMLFSFTGSALLSVALADKSDPNVVMAALGNGAGIAVAGGQAVQLRSRTAKDTKVFSDRCALALPRMLFETSKAELRPMLRVFGSCARSGR